MCAGREEFCGKSGRVLNVSKREEPTGYSISPQDGWIVTVKLDGQKPRHFGWEWIVGATPERWPFNPAWPVQSGCRVTVRREPLVGLNEERSGTVVQLHRRYAQRGARNGWVVDIRFDSGETQSYGWEWLVWPPQTTKEAM